MTLQDVLVVLVALLGVIEMVRFGIFIHRNPVPRGNPRPK